MTDDQKRAKIAESLGWIKIAENTWQFGPRVAGIGVPYCAQLPDWFHDANETAQMRAALTEEEHGLYVDALMSVIDAEWEICVDVAMMPFTWFFRALNATPAQQAEAFGKTLNLW